MSIKLPIVNVKDINWKNHDSSFNIFQDIVVGDIAIIENKLECVLPLDDNEYCVMIMNIVLLLIMAMYLLKNLFRMKNARYYSEMILVNHTGI